MPLREARRTMHSPAAVSAQHHGDRAQHIKKLSGEGLDLICAQRSQQPQGNNEDVVKCSWKPVSDSHDADGSFTVTTLKLVSQSFGKSARFLQMCEETLCAVTVCLRLVEITV